MKDLKDLTVVITGASSGIGAELATQLARQGARVALVARRDDALRDVTKRCGSEALPIVADVTRRDEVQRVVREAIARFGTWTSGSTTSAAASPACPAGCATTTLTT